MSHLIYKSEAYKIIGLCMEVHKILGKGHSEVVYKDALNMNFKSMEFLIVGKRSMTSHIKILFYQENIMLTL